MKTEVEIAKGFMKYGEGGSTSVHKETCERFLEFLESFGYIMPSRLEIKRLDKIKELKQAIEVYDKK